MFELLCIISMALRDVSFFLVLVMWESKEFFIDTELSDGGEGGGFHVTSEDRYFFVV